MIIEEIIKYNEQFVASKGYEKYLTSKYPDKKLAILSCMDTRLTELLPAALGLKNGDAKLIKNAGGLVISPFDSAMRSLLVAIYELGVEEIMVIAHSNCGACHMNGQQMKELMLKRGIHQMLSIPSDFAALILTIGWRDSTTQRTLSEIQSIQSELTLSYQRMSICMAISSIPRQAD